MNKNNGFAINWMTNPEKDVVKETKVLEKKVSEKIKKKLKEEEEQKKRDAEIEAKEKERLAKNTPVSSLSFANIRNIGQERVDEKARKEREYHEEGERRKAKAIAEESVSAGLLVNSTQLKSIVEKNIGKYDIEVRLERIKYKEDHNHIESTSYSKVTMYLFANGWNSDFGVWSIQHVAEYAKTSLDNSGFKTGNIETYTNCYRNTVYSFTIDLTSMFEAK